MEIPKLFWLYMPFIKFFGARVTPWSLDLLFCSLLKFASACLSGDVPGSTPSLLHLQINQSPTFLKSQTYSLYFYLHLEKFSMKLIHVVNNQTYINGTEGQKLKGKFFLCLWGFAILLCSLNLPRYVLAHALLHIYILLYV